MLARIKGRGVFRLLCLLVCALLLSGQTLAAGSASLTVNYSRGNTEFQLYLVAKPFDSSYIFTSDFTGCGVALPDAGSSNSLLRTAAQELAKYVDWENISENRSGRVSGGSVTFSGLEEGWYLVTGDSHTVVGGTRYTPITFLVYVDGPETANAKADSTTPGTAPEDPDDPSDPEDPDDPDEPGEPDDPDDPDDPNGPEEPGEPDIPQTGQLWWPVPLLACGGMALFLTGWLRRRGSADSDADE